MDIILLPLLLILNRYFSAWRAVIDPLTPIPENLFKCLNPATETLEKVSNMS